MVHTNVLAIFHDKLLAIKRLFALSTSETFHVVGLLLVDWILDGWINLFVTLLQGGKSCANKVTPRVNAWTSKKGLATNRAGGIKLLSATVNAVRSAILVVKGLASQFALTTGTDETLVVPFLVHGSHHGAGYLFAAFGAFIDHFCWKELKFM